MGRIATSLVLSSYYGTLLCDFLEYKWVVQRHSCNNTQKNTQNRLMRTIEFGQRFGELVRYKREIP